MKPRHTRAVYTKEFKSDAVKLVLEQGYSANEVAKRLGVNQTSVSRWVREYRQDNEPTVDSTATRSELEAEVKRLSKENQRLKMERDILKKATAFFAKESN